MTKESNYVAVFEGHEDQNHLGVGWLQNADKDKDGVIEVGDRVTLAESMQGNPVFDALRGTSLRVVRLIHQETVMDGDIVGRFDETDINKVEL